MAGKSLNRVQLIGNLGKDPEIKYTPSGTPVAKITIATNERFKDKGGEWQDRTEWHNVVLWQRLAEIAGEYLKKGGKVYIEGRLQTRSWEDKQTNQKKYMTEVVANDLVLLGGRSEGGDSSRIGGNNFDQRTPEAEPAPVGAMLRSRRNCSASAENGTRSSWCRVCRPRSRLPWRRCLRAARTSWARSSRAIRS